MERMPDMGYGPSWATTLMIYVFLISLALLMVLESYGVS